MIPPKYRKLADRVADKIEARRTARHPTVTLRVVLCRSDAEAAELERKWIEAGRPGKQRQYSVWQSWPEAAPVEPPDVIEAPEQPASSASAPAPAVESARAGYDYIPAEHREPRSFHTFEDYRLPAIGEWTRPK